MNVPCDERHDIMTELGLSFRGGDSLQLIGGATY